MSQIISFGTTSSTGSVTTLTGNVGGAVSPTAGNINIVGDTGVTITGNPGTSTLTVAVAGVTPTTYDADSGSATPAANILIVAGSHGINTSGAGNTITAAVNNTLTLGDLSPVAVGSSSLTLTTGDLSVSSGNLNLPTTSASGDDGVINVNATRFIHSYGADNSFVGSSAGNFTLTGLENTAVGSHAMTALTDGGSNIAVGYHAALILDGGDRNTAVGTRSLETVTTGTDNIAVGYEAGSSYSTTDSFNISIGNIGVAAESATIRIGTNGDHTNTYIAGIDGVNVGSVAKVLSMSSDHIGTTTITAGAGITVTPGANTITLTSTASGGVLVWTVITANQTAAVNNGYIANKAGTLALLLPATASVGDVIRITGINTATGWQVTQNANQQIFFGTSSTTLGVGGSITSTNIRDAIELICVVAGASTVWNVTSSIGNPTIV